MSSFESPEDLARRLRLGREEFLQRLITSLIVGGAYPRWNSRNTPSQTGQELLRRLHELSFPGVPWSPATVFVDELDLPPRHPDERGGAPDWAVVWPDRLWIVELKTEAASHRPSQIPSYFELGAHHFAGAVVDITYLTPPLAKPAPPVPAGSRYAHLAWADVAPLLAATLSAPDDIGATTVAAAALRVIAGLGGPARHWRETFLGTASPSATDPGQAVDADRPAPDDVDADDPLAVVRLTADDGQQRPVPSDAASLEDLQALRLRLRTSIAAAPAGDPARRVVPWLWSAGTSTGRAMSPDGAEHGFEVRVSRYAAEQYG